MALKPDLGLSQYDLWTIKKTLAAGDLVGSVTLSKDEMEWYIIPKMERSGIHSITKTTLLGGPFVTVENIASNEGPRLVRLILSHGQGPPHYGSYSFMMGWPDIVTSKKLKARDTIGLCWDRWAGRFKFMVIDIA
ncbi:unnamed protein product [Arabis nemorensis]|uniref:TF-B3 domain-containing protein n=1 Tax=Arabis nemorensis TaxID=586526 RepID=A0A565B9Y0_9BRAS|nr:unnamed protein product [Arabis nemorensis]